jgi:hypothetical protein
MLRTDGPQHSNFRRLKFQLNLAWRPFAIGAIFKTPQSNRKMRSGMQRRAPDHLPFELSKLSKSEFGVAGSDEETRVHGIVEF